MAGAAKKHKQAKKPAKEKGSRPVDYRVDDFTLDVPGSGTFDLDIAEAITSADLELTIEGASTLTLSIEDPDQALLQSGTLTTWVWGREDNIGKESKWLTVGRAVDAVLDDIDFRLVKVSKAESKLTLTFEERAVSLLRRKKGARKAPRSKVTRAQFVRTLAKEVKAYGGVPTYIPELKKKQAISKKSEKTSKDDRAEDGGAGLPKGAKLTVKKKPANSEQLKNMQRVLDTADSRNPPRNALLAVLVACIQESTFRNLSGGHSSSVGILQLLNIHGTAAERKDIERCVGLFFDEGFTGKGGATEIARENSGLSPAEIATRVQGNAAGAADYKPWIAEAKKIANAYSGDGVGGGSETFSKSYQYSRGKAESSWDAIGRLADEVKWRRFMRRGKLWYVSENFLFRQQPELVISEGTEGVDWVDFEVDMFARPTKRGVTPVAEVSVQARADTWTALPGMVVAVEEMGIIDGRWLVSAVSRSLVDDAEACQITLRKPIPLGREPAAETGSADDEDAGDTPSGNVGGQTTGLDEDLKELLGLIAGKTTETITVTSGVRSGDTDSHHRNGRAADINVGGDARSSPAAASKGDNIATAVLVVCGQGTHNARKLAQSGALNFGRNFNWKGHSIEVGWRTDVGGNHHNHVHVGFDT